MTWAAIGAAGVSAGAGLIASKSGKKGTPGGTQINVAPQYSFTEPRMNLVSDFISDQFRSIGEGNFPKYFENARPKIQANLERGLDRTFFGRPGNRTGIYSQKRASGAAMGMGPKATLALEGRVDDEFIDRERQIDEFIEQAGLNTTNQLLPSLIQGSNQMPKGPDAFMANYAGSAPQQSPMLTAFSQLAGSPAFQGLMSKGISGIGGMFQQGGGGGFKGGFYDSTGGGFTPTAPHNGGHQPFNFQMPRSSSSGIGGLYNTNGTPPRQWGQGSYTIG